MKAPPSPFKPAIETLPKGHRLYRVFTNTRPPTDFNPGTSPTPNVSLVLTLGVSQLRLSVAEAVIAATVNGAAAVALADRVGQIAPGFAADFGVFSVTDVREVPYWYGDNRCVATFVAGKPCHTSDLGIT